VIDQIIVSIYIITVFLVGIYHSRGLTSLRDFSGVNRGFATPVIMATISATYIGAEFVFGIAEKAYSVGTVFLVALLGASIGKCLMATYIVPRLQRFNGAMSIGDIMQEYYGQLGRVTSGLSGSILCIGYVGVQIAACSSLFQYFFHVPSTLGVIIGSGTLIIYSAFGGFKAVTFTDVLQYAVLIVAIPLVCNIELNNIGGYTNLIKLVPDTHIFPSKESIISHMPWLIYYTIPFFNPAVMQRLLMDKDSKKVASAWRISALIDIPFYIVVCTIGLIALANNPNLPANLAFASILEKLPVGLAGIAIIGLLSVIMSTADSYLNASSIALVNDVIKPLYKKKIHDKTELKLARLLTILLGISAVVIAIKMPNMIDAIVHYITISWAPLVVAPLYACIFDLRTSGKSFIAAGVCGLAMRFLLPFCINIESEIIVTTATIFSSALGLLLSNYIFTGKFPVFNFSLPRITFPNLGVIFIFMKKLIGSSERVHSFGAPYSLFGLFAIVNYIIPYFMWSNANSNHYDLHLVIRFLAASLCFILLMHDHWPTKLKKFLPIYWHLTLLFCLPFFATFMLFDNNFSDFWLYSIVLAFFLLAALTDWLSFTSILIIGSLFGYGFHTLVGETRQIALDSNAIYAAIYMYSFAVFIGILFARRNEKLMHEKLTFIRSVSASIVHEMRTPLATISVGAHNLQKFFPTYEEAYQKAQQNNLLVNNITQREHAILKEIPATLERVSNSAQNIINMLLVNTKEIPINELEQCSILNCIEIALDQYPFKDTEREKITLKISTDFLFWGKRELFIHIIFNLLKNSLYQISHKIDGTIEISTLIKNDKKYLYWTDNGMGISKQLLPKIFDCFITGTNFGTGMGLPYCRMVMTAFGGDIQCISKPDESAQFELSFR
jgi:Na+/proline symporter/signal transduction histidine kinase